LLYTTTSGLESWHDGRWIPLDPLPGHFTLVLGHAFEVLTEKMHTPVNASYHRVRKMPELRSGQADRFSFGSYLGPRWDQDLYQYDGETLRAVQSVVAFQRQKAAEMAYEFHPKIERARDGGYQ
jgi:isopenicillin N synthase-like dioxygenase